MNGHALFPSRAMPSRVARYLVPSLTVSEMCLIFLTLVIAAAVLFASLWSVAHGLRMEWYGRAW